MSTTVKDVLRRHAIAKDIMPTQLHMSTYIVGKVSAMD